MVRLPERTSADVEAWMEDQHQMPPDSRPAHADAQGMPKRAVFKEKQVLDLNDFRYFVEVARKGGLSAAARSLGRPVSTIGHRIQRLEHDLGLTLFARTPRRVNLTPSGEAFLVHAVSTLERADEAEQAMRNLTNEPSGQVRFTVAVATAQYTMPAMVLSFLAKYPKVELVQDSCDAPLDIVAERYDVAIRAHSGSLPDSGLVQRPLASVAWHLFASSRYLKTAVPPRSPAELSEHALLFMRRAQAESVWNLRHEKNHEPPVRLPVRPRIHSACMSTLKRAALEGLGIVALPAHMCRDEAASGQLSRVLPDWVAADSVITALMPSRRGMSAASRAFLDHIVEAFPAAVRPH